MGYYAKDGSYVRDDSDFEPRPTQGDLWDAEQRVTEAMEREEARKRINEELEREARVTRAEEERLEKEEEVRQWEAAKQQAMDEAYKDDPTLWLKQPRDLAERRARANYWRLNSGFSLLVGKVSGKDRRFNDLWDQFSKAKTEEEKQRIVDELEKMYPTTEARIEAEERKMGRR